MFGGIVSLAVAKEVATAQQNLQKIADQHYTSGKTYTVNYDVSSRGKITGDFEEFRKLVAEVYTDARGWKRAGVTFNEVQSGGELHVILASGDQVAAASSGCSAELSCRVGGLVLINDARWMNATDTYNDLKVPLLEYRKMVINHETGHFLGHDHIAGCEIEGGLGPVMVQQSTGMRGCVPNSWPLPNELWVRR